MATIDSGETLIRLAATPQAIGRFVDGQVVTDHLIGETITVHFRADTGIVYFTRPRIVLPTQEWKEMRSIFANAVANPYAWVLELIGSLYEKIRGVSPILDLSYGHDIN